MGIVHDVHHHPNAREIDTILAQYVPPYVLAYLCQERAKIVPIPDGVTYARASTVIRRLRLDVDSWPNPPAGLFVAEERTVYLRRVSSMTIVHEVGHALDCALGGGVYRSGFDATIRRAFESATQFVTPYAATSVDEFFAETWRAYLGANDPDSLWPTVTRARLAASSPIMAAYFERVLAELERRPARQILLAPENARDRDRSVEPPDLDASARAGRR